MKQNNENSRNQCILEDLIPLSKFNDYYKYPSVGALRQLVFYKDKYNFHNITKKLGNRLYISISAFNKWVEEQNQLA